MKPEYDFTHAVRGKFYARGQLKLPAYASYPKKQGQLWREAIAGFDSAWTNKSPGSICVARFQQEHFELQAPKLVHFEEAVQIVEELRKECRYVLVAIDQPTLVPNEVGMRPVERVAASLIGKLRSGVQPANRRKHAMFGPNAPIWGFLDRIEAHGNPDAAREATCGLHLMEVFPALALPALQPHIMKRQSAARYNPKSRNFSMADWRLVASTVEHHADRLGIATLSQWACKVASHPKPNKGDQDCVDAAICLLIALHWRRAPRDSSVVIGDSQTGYMVTPVSPETKVILKRAADKTHVSIDGTWPKNVEQ